MRDKNFLQNAEYDFLSNHKDLNNIIYLTLSGSYAYGTNNQDSDIDLRGVLIEDRHYLFGLTGFEQFEDLVTDTVIYSLKKFIALCVAGNPNALELLGTDKECIVRMTAQGEKLRENVNLFLTRQVVNSFGQYASAQLRRLSNALCHDRYTAAEQEKHLCDTLNAQMEHFNRTYIDLPDGSIKIYLDEMTQNLLCDLKLEGYPLRDFSGIYSELQNTIKTYGKLNHRNRKKDDKHLYKHAMHLIRLLLTGKDILDGKGIITRRTVEHQLLMDIRNGNYSFDDIFTLAAKYQSDFEQAARNSRLPDKPDMCKVENLLLELYE